MTIRQLLLGTVPALMLAITPAYAASKCVTAHDDQPITVRGTIVQSATTEEGEGGNPPHKYMAVVLETPICGDPDEMKTMAVDPVSMKWLGHDAFVTGIMTPTGEGSYIAVQHIIDSNTSEETIMDWRDTAAVVNEICPDLSNAGWLAALVNAHDSRAWNRAADIEQRQHRKTVALRKLYGRSKSFCSLVWKNFGPESNNPIIDRIK